jgi:NitT/TauT family transport system substrate-binding protein
MAAILAITCSRVTPSHRQDKPIHLLLSVSSLDAIRQIGAGNAMFGFIDAGSLILARANDQIPVKLVASVYSKPPHAIFCREDSGLKKPKDLEGNAIVTTAGAAVRAVFPAFAKAAGFDALAVRWGVASSESLPGLLAANKFPCIGEYTVAEALLRSQLAPAKLVRFAYADAGLSYWFVSRICGRQLAPVVFQGHDTRRFR